MQHDDPEDPEIFYNTGKKQNNKRTTKATQSLIQIKANIKEIFSQFSDQDIDRALKKANGQMNGAVDILLKQDNDVKPPKKVNLVSQHLDKLDKIIQEDSQTTPQQSKKFDEFMDFFYEEELFSNTLNQDDYDTQYYQLQHILENIMEDEDVKNTMEDCQASIQQWMKNQGQFQQGSIYYNEQSSLPPDFLQSVQVFIERHLNVERELKMSKPYDEDSYEDFPSLNESKGPKIYNNSPQKQSIGFHNDQFEHIDQNNNFWTKPDQNKIYQVNNSGSQAIQTLCEDFPQLPLEQLKSAFDYINDYHRTKEFLREYCPQYHQQQKVKKTHQPDDGTWVKLGGSKKPISTHDMRRVVEEYQQRRREINEKKCIADVLRHRLNKNGANKNQYQIRSLVDLEYQKLRTLYDSSHDLLIQMIDQNQSNIIDLHGIFAEEVTDLLSKFIQNRRNKMVEVIVGRGQHSKNQVSVLTPIVQDFFRKLGYECSKSNPGSLTVKIK